MRPSLLQHLAFHITIVSVQMLLQKAPMAFNTIKWGGSNDQTITFHQHKFPLTPQ